MSCVIDQTNQLIYNTTKWTKTALFYTLYNGSTSWRGSLRGDF